MTKVKKKFPKKDELTRMQHTEFKVTSLQEAQHRYYAYKSIQKQMGFTDDSEQGKSFQKSLHLTPSMLIQFKNL